MIGDAEHISAHPWRGRPNGAPWWWGHEYPERPPDQWVEWAWTCDACMIHLVAAAGLEPPREPHPAWVTMPPEIAALFVDGKATPLYPDLRSGYDQDYWEREQEWALMDPPIILPRHYVTPDFPTYAREVLGLARVLRHYRGLVLL